MIQDIYPHVYHNEFTPVPYGPGSVVLAYEERGVLARFQEGTLVLPRAEELPFLGEEDVIWLFRLDEQNFFLSRQSVPEGDGFTYVPIRHMRMARPRSLAFAAVTGLSLCGWYHKYRLCGSCGRPLVASTKERMLYCPECQIMNYPRINPAVIVGVRHDDALLVSVYAGREYKNTALLAGFAEIGETIEETVHREVMEEVGIHVKNLTFYKSQPWCFTDTLLFGFFCDLDGKADLHVDHSELATAQWLQRQDLPDDREHTSLTMEMITLFKQGKA